MLPSVSERGFTLVELLLALGISAFIAVLAYAGLSTVLDADAALRREVQRLDEVQRALLLIEEDLSQLRPRAVNEGRGRHDAALAGGSFASPLLIFTRGGLDNPAGLQRSDLQRVHYVLDGGRLWRLQRPMLDTADPGAVAQATLLLEGIQALQLGFLRRMEQDSRPLDALTLNSAGVLWDDFWDSSALRSGQLNLLPQAIRLSLQLDGIGEVERVIALP
jgi:general secretion pathway protein J